MHVLLSALAVAGGHEVAWLFRTETDAADGLFHFGYWKARNRCHKEDGLQWKEGNSALYAALIMLLS